VFRLRCPNWLSCAARPGGRAVSKSNFVYEPDRVFWIHVAACFFVAICATLAFILFRLPSNEPALFSNLLSTLITVSGVTAPLSIAYLTVRDRDLQISIADRATHLLRESGISIPALRLANLFLSEFGGSGPSRALAVVTEFDRGLSKEGKEWLFGSDEDSSIYERYFAKNDDRDLIVRYVSAIGLLAILCFFAMYLGSFGLRHIALDCIEVFLVTLTAAANVAAYVFIVKTIKFKDRIKRRASDQIRNACDTIPGEVTNAIGTAKRLEGELTEELKRRLAHVVREDFTPGEDLD
jgi:hypothetical protein